MLSKPGVSVPTMAVKSKSRLFFLCQFQNVASRNKLATQWTKMSGKDVEVVFFFFRKDLIYCCDSLKLPGLPSHSTFFYGEKGELPPESPGNRVTGEEKHTACLELEEGLAYELDVLPVPML